ncbi:unnamed protein product [Closterium sp. NIES-64]|nr:unnamed protein product [Closterium sp. NIES-64]
MTRPPLLLSSPWAVALLVAVVAVSITVDQSTQPDSRALIAFPFSFPLIPVIPLIPLLKLCAKQSTQQNLRTLCALPAFAPPLLFPLIPLLDLRAKQSAQQYLRSLLAFPLPLRAQQSTQPNLRTLRTVPAFTLPLLFPSPIIRLRELRARHSRPSPSARRSPRKRTPAPSAPSPPSTSESPAPETPGSGGTGSHRTEESVGGVGGASPLTTLTLLPDNPYKAKCLDGSPPGYYFRQGVGTGASNWLIDLPVGGWCTTVQECAKRAGTEFGSTRRWPKVLGGGGAAASAASAVADAVYQYSVTAAGVRGSSRGILITDPRVNPTFHILVHSPFPTPPPVSSSRNRGRRKGTAAGARSSSRGILSTDPRVNPTFHNWNLVRFVYCDGGGYAGRVRWKPVNSSLIVYLDGWRISKAIFMDLRTRRGLTSATNIIMSGSSAGGQAVVTLCDQLAEMAPAARTKCLMDSGFFIDSPDRAGVYSFRAMAQRLVGLHQSLGNPRCQRGE